MNTDTAFCGGREGRWGGREGGREGGMDGWMEGWMVGGRERSQKFWTNHYISICVVDPMHIWLQSSYED